jgi:hypothetical protein
MTKPSTSGTAKTGTSKVKFKKTGNPVWDAYGKAWETQTNAGQKFTATQGLGRPIGPHPEIKPKPKTKKKKKKVLSNGHISSNKGSNKNDGILSRPPLSSYKWNLPPHTWSLPLKPETINGGVSNGIGDIEQYRRGRLWWYASVDSIMVDADGKDQSKKAMEERTFGFQFIWNPDSYTTSVSLNTDVTPNVNDRFIGVAGAFPSGETISFNLRLDRTNDFAAARNLIQKDYASTPTFDNKGKAIYKSSTTDKNAFKEMISYYTTGLGNTTEDEKLQKIKDLMELGTVSDLEYLYKAVNGDGWKNASGRRTSDIGYLAATLLRVDIGPLSYIGYITSLSINHVGFSQDMTPIRTDVTLALNLMASAGQDFANTGANATGDTKK